VRVTSDAYGAAALAHLASETPSRSRPAGDEPDEPATEMYRYVLAKLSFSSLEVFYQAVVDARAKGRSAGRVKYLQFVHVVKDVAKYNVFLKCTMCHMYSARNPSDSVGKHFVQDKDGMWSCGGLHKAQSRVDANQTLVVVNQGWMSSSSCCLCFLLSFLVHAEELLMHSCKVLLKTRVLIMISNKSLPLYSLCDAST
jgi:hypothetical protein